MMKDKEFGESSINKSIKIIREPESSFEIHAVLVYERSSEDGKL